jgi:hypothetical protein
MQMAWPLPTAIFWSNQANSEMDANIFRRSTSASSAAVSILPGGYRPSRIVADAQTLYFTMYGDAGKVAKTTTAGGSPTVLVPGKGEGGDLAADENALYWGSSEAIVAIDKRTGVVTPLAAAQGHPARLAVDATRVYWVSPGRPASPNTEPAGVFAISKNGGAVARLATITPQATAALALTSSDVYWADGAQIRHVAK